MSETCETCRFFHKREPQFIYGDCHRFPPQGEWTANFTEDGYERRRFKVEVSRFQNARFPNLSQDDWCGEYQPRKETQQ